MSKDKPKKSAPIRKEFAANVEAKTMPPTTKPKLPSIDDEEYWTWVF